MKGIFKLVFTIQKVICCIMIYGGICCSCTKFLKEENKTQYSVDYIYSSTEGLKLSVNALYALQRNLFNDNNGNESPTWWALERGTDIVASCGGTGNFYGIYDPAYLKPSAAQVGILWKTLYQIIGRCNEIIWYGEQMEESDDLKCAIAEARCFRAQSYFRLFRIYDRIWLNTEPVMAENVNKAREYHAATAAEVYDLLYSDLEYAADNLPWKSYEPGRFNQAVARHILAKVALCKKDYKTALDQIDAIEESGQFSLLSEPSAVFNAADLNHSESLMTQQWSDQPGGNFSAANPKGNQFCALFIAQYRTALGGGDDVSCSAENWGYTFGRILPNPYLLSLYNPLKDKRYTDWYIHRYRNTRNVEVTYNSIKVKPGEYLPAHTGGSGDPRYTMPGCTKWGDVWTKAPAEKRGFKDVILYRLADSYIVGAEAALRLNDQTKAKYYFNKTWQRAGNDEFKGTLSIQDIIDEEARELAFENDRWFFLKRLGILIEQVSLYAGNPIYAASLKGRTNLPANPQFVRWPIPESEIINMGAENFPQNPGY